MLFWLCLLLHTTSPALTPDNTETPTSIIQTHHLYETYRGWPIVEVTFDVEDDSELEEIVAMTDIRPGYLLNEEIIQHALQRLYALDRYADIRVHINPVGTAVELRFVLVSRLHVGTIALHHQGKANIQSLRDRLQTQQGQPFSPNSEAHIHTQIQEALRDLGYPHTQITIQSTKTNAKVNLAIQITEGPHNRIAEIVWKGTWPVPEAFLMPYVYTRIGNITQRTLLEADRARVMQALIDHDFPAANVRLDYEPVTPTSDRIIFNVNLALRTQLTFQGHTLFSNAQLLSLWPHETALVTETDLDMLERRIKDAYAAIGFPRVTITRMMRTVPGQSQVTVLNIQEGAQIAIDNIAFDGANGINAQELNQHIRNLLRDATRDRLLPRLTQLINTHSHVLTEETLAEAPTARSIPTEKLFLESILETAPESLHQLYQSRGFLGAQIDPPTYNFHDNQVSVRYRITEGPQFSAFSVVFQNNQSIPSHELLQHIDSRIALGKPMQYPALDDAKTALIGVYRNRGFIYARCSASLQSDETTGQVNVIFHFEEGPEVAIQRVLIRGNKQTYTRLIRGRIHLKSGDIYTIQKALEDQRAISQLDVFSSVRVRLLNENIPAEQKDLVVDVREKKRHKLNLNAGLSITQGPRIRLQYQHANLFKSALSLTTALRLNRQVFFPLYGKYGSLMQARYDGFHGIEQFSHALEREIRIGLRSPPLRMLPMDPLFRLDIVNGRENAVPYSLDTVAVIVGADLHLNPHVTWVLEPQFSIANLSCADDNTDLDCERQANTSPTAAQRATNRGLRRTFKLNSVLTLDLRDNPLAPKKGFYAQIFTTFAYGEARDQPASNFHELFSGGVDNPFSFTRIEGRLTGYIPLGIATLALSARGGTIMDHKHQCAPADERFYLGGRDTVRGFLERTIFAQDSTFAAGTQDSCIQTIQQIFSADNPTPVSRGGNHYVLAKGELRLPIHKGFGLGVFVDAGNLWVDTPDPKTLKDLRIGTGAGLRYDTPVGLLALDVGVNPKPRTYRLADGTPTFSEQIWQIHFSVGSF